MKKRRVFGWRMVCLFVWLHWPEAEVGVVVSRWRQCPRHQLRRHRGAPWAWRRLRRRRPGLSLASAGHGHHT